MMPQRIQRRREKGWRMPPGAVYVGRPTIWGNPWKPGHPLGRIITRDAIYTAPPMTHGAAAGQYRRWLAGWGIAFEPLDLTPAGRAAFRAEMEHRRQALLARLPELRGHGLACWCPLGCDCHADILLELANA